jgi:hypothetical protein
MFSQHATAAAAAAAAVAAVMVAVALPSFGVCALHWVTARCFCDALQIVTAVAAQLAGVAPAVERLPAQLLVR